MRLSRREHSIPSGYSTADLLLEEFGQRHSLSESKCISRPNRIHTPHLPPGIPSLERLVSGEADNEVTIPGNLPAVTTISEAVNSHQHRFSDTPIHENLHSNIAP